MEGLKRWYLWELVKDKPSTYRFPPVTDAFYALGMPRGGN